MYGSELISSPNNKTYLKNVILPPVEFIHILPFWFLYWPTAIPLGKESRNDNPTWELRFE